MGNKDSGHRKPGVSQEKAKKSSGKKKKQKSNEKGDDREQKGRNATSECKSSVIIGRGRGAQKERRMARFPQCTQKWIQKRRFGKKE